LMRIAESFGVSLYRLGAVGGVPATMGGWGVVELVVMTLRG